MSRKLIDLLKIQNDESARNSFYRYRKGKPTFTHYENYIQVENEDKQCKIYRIDEIILYLIQDFRFLPIWLIQQWYEDFQTKKIYKILEDWINCGLVWIQTDASGIFVRPTKELLDLFGTKAGYEPIPKQFLNHKFSEAQIIFDVLMGNEKSEFWSIIKEEELLPFYSPLSMKYTEKQSGTIVIRENYFRTFYFDKEKLLQDDKELKREIESGKRLTKEFTDFSLFQIVTQNQTRHGNIALQVPDIVIPIPRINGEPQSYAIELELTNKGVEKYINILKNYTNNQKFGKLFYLCGDTKVAKALTQAYNKIGGMGNCKLYLMPFVPPAMKLTNYSLEDEENNKVILRLTK